MILSLLVSLMSTTAWAQAAPGSGFDAHGFRLAAHDRDVRDPLVVQRPGAFEAHSWFAGGVLEYAAQPLVFATPTGNVTQLDNLVVANMSVGYAPLDRVRLDLGAPLFLYGEGTEGAMGAGLGDIRASSLVELVRPEDGPNGGGLGTALTANIDLPTGRPESYQGQTTVSGGVGIAVSYEMERLTFSAAGGTQLRPNTSLDERPAPTKGGDAFTWGGSVGYVLSDTSGVTVEVHGEVAADDDVRSALGTPVEALLSMRNVREDGGYLTAGIGTGLTRGAGASPLRLIVGGGFGSGGEKPVVDLDGDSIVDAEDACPNDPETMNGFNDKDGCPDEPGVLTFRAIGPGGNPRADAKIVVEGPLEMDGMGSLTFQGEAVTPNSPWLATANVGECLKGVKDFAMGPEGGEAIVDVNLTRRRSGKVRVEVTDPDGNPVDGAVVRFRSDEEPCSPRKFDDFTEGVGEMAVGPGMHFAFVSAEGFGIHQESFVLKPNGEKVIKANLKTALAQLDTSDSGQTVIRILEKVFFDTGKASIQDRSHELLIQVASVIKANGIENLEVGGHTDSQGSEANNLDLSQRRAEAVKAYLVGEGVPVMSLIAKGYGESTPVASNGTSSGRAKNRRVEFQVVDNRIPAQPVPDAPTPEETR